MLRSILLLLCLGVAACEQPTQAPADRTDPATETRQPASPPTAAPFAQVSSLAGEWRVAGIDGLSRDEPIGLSLTGDDQQLWWQPRCAGMARNYRVDGQMISFGSTLPPAPAGSPPPPVCAIGLPPRLSEVFRALDDAVSITRTPENGVVISGPSHSLTLFSQ